MKHFIVIITCFVVMFCRRLKRDAPLFQDMSITPAFQPVLNGGQIPLPGDIPVLNRKIYRGIRVTVQEHPYMASIRRLFSHYLCGVIISRNLILTIAHPLENVPTYDLGVVVGENYSDRGTSIMPVILVIVHEDFDPYKLTGDLAMIRLYSNIVYRVNIKPIGALAIRGKTDINQKVFVTGWGRCDVTGKELCLPRSSQYFPGEKIDPMLKTIYIRNSLNRARESCYNLYKRVFEISPDPNMLCLGYLREQFPSSPCMAVPGAAALVNASLLGLQSWGFGCGYKQDLPVVYTDLRKYYEWIFNTTKILHEVPMANLTMLYQLTIAKDIYDWFAQTREYIPNRTQIVDEEIQMFPFDEKLALIEGKVYDIRDYILEGRFHETKQKNYESIRFTKRNVRNEKLKALHDKLEDLDIEPFIPYTIPTVDSDDSDTGDNY